jgi:hypothetical protein
MTHITSAAKFLSLVGTLMVGTVAAGTADAADRYATIWEKSSGPAWLAQHRIPASTYQAEFDKHVKDGYRLKVVSGYGAAGLSEDDILFFATIWEKSSGPAWLAEHGVIGADYQAKFDQHVKDGYRLKMVNSYLISATDAYATVWEKSSGPAWLAQHRIAAANYQTEFDKHVKDGYALKVVSGTRIPVLHEIYATIWEKSSGPAWLAEHGLTGADYQTKFDQHVKDGYRLKVVNVHNVGGQDVFATVWEKGSGPAWLAEHGVAGDDYQAKFDQHVKDGYRLIWVSGY